MGWGGLLGRGWGDYRRWTGSGVRGFVLEIEGLGLALNEKYVFRLYGDAYYAYASVASQNIPQYTPTLYNKIP